VVAEEGQVEHGARAVPLLDEEEHQERGGETEQDKDAGVGPTLFARADEGVDKGDQGGGEDDETDPVGTAGALLA
jgi:hypothetical protein